MSTGLRGGKTAPRLFHDLLLYDPRKPPPHKFNILTEIPVHDAEQENHLPPPPLVGKGSCRHQWSLKRKQCSLPETGYNPDEQTVWLIAAYCAVCRSHLDLQLDCRTANQFFRPCPNIEQPLHHFVYRAASSGPRQMTKVHGRWHDGFQWTDTHQFQCSSWECAAVLTVRFKPPRLTQDWVDLLTDIFVIKDRAERAIAADPERFEGFAVPPPIDVLQHSKHYITNPLFNPEKSKKIQGHNKRFLLSMGSPCAEILEYFGFTREEDDWLPPQLDPTAEPPFPENSVNVRIDDVEKELSVLISQASFEAKRKAKPEWAPESAIKELKSVLGCLDCEFALLFKQRLLPDSALTGLDRKNIRSRTVDLTRSEEHPFYAGLGAVEDFHDELIRFAYERQIENDGSNTAYYLECLQGIAEGRDSENLHVKVAIEATSEKISRRDVRAAYRELGLDGTKIHEDDNILGIFNSRTADAPKQEPDMRRALKIIGQDRSSEKILIVASQAVTNYEQALSFLNAEPDTPDEWIPSLVTAKISDKPSDESTARRAVVLIARHRSSQALKKYLNTGQMGETEMDVDTAYASLDITDRNVDDELVLTTYNLRVSDNPLQLDSLKNAVAAIAKSRKSRRINDFLNTGMISSEISLSEWPVGLENIGNTCYLNSLLQFYFTIKPLRDLVLNADEFKMPIDEASLKTKRVGSRNVSRKEVTRAQQFVDELRTLFQSMITSSKASVTPESELARLTLVSSEKADAIRRQSMLSPTRPSLGEIHGQPVLGPLGPPPLEAPDDTHMADDVAPKGAEEKNIGVNHHLEGDSSSDVTLVDNPDAADPDAMLVDEDDVGVQKKLFEDKENLSPTKDEKKESSPEVEIIPLGESSPSRMNEQPGPLSAAKEHAKVSMDLTRDDVESPKTIRGSPEDESTTAVTAPPKRSPPLPPRPRQIDTRPSNALQEAEVGAQQDVTEVIANFLFQLQCAIKAEAVDASGEQIDRVKNLFFGKQKSYTTDKQGETRAKEDYMSDIKIDVATGSRDVYAALDGAYDVQYVEVAGGVEPQYTSISLLPPVLQIHVQRSLYDREKKAAFKSINHLKLEETIYMDRYMDSEDADLLERRRQCWQWKDEILSLEKRRAQLSNSEQGMDVPEVLEALQGYLQQISSSDDPDAIKCSPKLVQDLELFAREARAELEALESKIRDLNSSIASQFNDLRKIPYRLQSVFIHRGFHNSGHYWIYIYDFPKKMWRKYNDGYVTEIKDTTEIFDQEAGDRPATPYFVVYVKDEVKATLVDCVCRDPIQPPPQEKQDIVMHDYGQAVELPATESNNYRPIIAPQEYGVTEPYEDTTIDREPDAWDSHTQEAPRYGW